MSVLDVIVAPLLAPHSVLGLELHFLEAVATRNSPPVLLIHSAPGRYISIGRYHLYDAREGEPVERGGVDVYRRLTGGRLIGAGEGWLSLALIVPSPSSLLHDEAASLKPEQVMNRHARGLLAGLRALGVNCFYPGRDAITFERREIAMCTYEINESGAMLFEATVAVNRGMEEVVHDLERIDPEGRLTCPMYGPESATKMVRELDRDIGFDELARAISAGYRNVLGEIHCRDLTAIEIAQGEHRGHALGASGFINLDADSNSPLFTLKNRITAQLGSVEARVAITPAGIIDAMMLTGDFIANSRAVAELEHELRGKRFDLASISHAVTRTLSRHGNFILGFGELSNLVRLIARAN